MTRPTRSVADVTRIRFAFASDDDLLEGLVGFIAFQLSDILEVQCVALRITRRGDVAFAWPEKPDSRGRMRTVARPVSNSARLALEDALIQGISHHLPAIRQRLVGVRALGEKSIVLASPAGGVRSDYRELDRQEVRSPESRSGPSTSRHEESPS